MIVEVKLALLLINVLFVCLLYKRYVYVPKMENNFLRQEKVTNEEVYEIFLQ